MNFAPRFRPPFPGKAKGSQFVDLPASTVYLNANEADTLYQERTGASATTDAVSGDPLGTWKNPDSAQYFTAASDSVRPAVATAGSRLVITPDATNDYLLPTSTIDLGEQWWFCGLVRATGRRLFTLSSEFQGAVRALSGEWVWYNSGGTTSTLCDGDVGVWHVLTIIQNSTTEIEGRYNDGGTQSFTPYDDSSVSDQSIALFTQRTVSPFGGYFAGSLAGCHFGTGAITAAERRSLWNFWNTEGAGLIGT